jgi:ATP-dependent exoDNAse (exonuclease V) beta subunit
MPSSWQSLAFQNEHERDKHVHFDEPTHIYTVKGETFGYISVTKFLHEFFPHFDPEATIKKMMKSPKWPESKWFGMTAEEIKAAWDANGKEASGAGTAMHLAIEQFLNGAPQLIPAEILQTAEWKYFQNFWKDHGEDLVPYRTEWEVWSEEYRLTGSIDMIFYRKSDDSYVIYDWKRSKEIKTSNKWAKGYGPCDHLDDCNYWHYSLQLNVYRWILENLYDMEIADMYLIICHPNNKNYIRMRLNRLQDEVEGMLDCRKRAIVEGWSQPVKMPIPEPRGGTQVAEDYAFLD